MRYSFVKIINSIGLLFLVIKTSKLFCFMRISQGAGTVIQNLRKWGNTLVQCKRKVPVQVCLLC